MTQIALAGSSQKWSYIDTGGGTTRLLRTFVVIVIGGLLMAVAYKTLLQGTQVDVGRQRTDGTIRNSTKSGEESTDAKGSLPTVLLAGVRDAGTADIVAFLKSHSSDVCFGCDPTVTSAEALEKEKKKEDGCNRDGELHFFDSPRLQKVWGTPKFKEEVARLRLSYLHCADDEQQLLVDATPECLPYAEWVRKVYDFDSSHLTDKVKIIFTLRDPMSTYLSRYNEQLCSTNSTTGGAQDDFDYFLRFIRRGSDSLYADGLETWFDLFNRHQILILQYDELQNDPETYFGRITSFLGLSAEAEDESTNSQLLPSPDSLLPACNHALEQPLCSSMFFRLRDSYAQSNQELYELLHAKKGPSMEQRPFPAFEPLECNNSTDDWKNRIPTVLLAGVERAATTSVAAWLDSLDGVCFGQRWNEDLSSLDIDPFMSRKELHFFNRLGRLRWNSTEMDEQFEKLRRSFDECNVNNETRLVDATPHHLTKATRIRKAYDIYAPEQVDELKIIFILREPMGTFVSGYNEQVCWQHQQQGNETSTERIAFRKYVLNKRDKGEGLLYAKSLKEWFQLFRRDQILLLQYDELRDDPSIFLGRIRYFLGLDSVRLGSEVIPNENAATCDEKLLHPPCSLALNKLYKTYEKSNQELYKLLESNHGPTMEQRPFLKFEPLTCANNTANEDQSSVEGESDQPR